MLALLLVAGLMVSMVAGCAPSGDTGGGEEPADEPKPGGEMSFYIGEPAYLDPYNAQESEGMQVTQVLFDSLTDLDVIDPTKIVPSAAESWEPNEDATVWTFRLNPDGKFSDGTPVTAQDFVYAWNRIANPETLNTSTGKADPSIISYHLAFVKGFDAVAGGEATEMEGLKAVDDLTLEVTLSQSFADFEYVVAHPALGPVSAKLVEEGVDNNGENVAFGEMPIGNGPFKMAEPWKHNQYVKVARNDAYWGDAPYLDGVEFRIFKDPETAFTEFEAGNLDFTQIGEGKIADAKAKYGESADGYTVAPGEQVLLGEQLATYYLIMNNEDEILKNKDVRRAITLAINRQAICDTVFDGTRSPADSILPPAMGGYVAGAWADSKYDMEAAKQALVDAGYPEGEGLPTISLAFNSGGGHEKIMELIQSDLKAIGIETEFESSDFPVYLKMLDEGKHQLARLGWVADYPIAYNFHYSLFNSEAGDNKALYKNPAVDTAIAEGQTITDTAARITHYEGVDATIGADNPVAPIMFYRNNHVGSDRIKDFALGPMHFGSFEKAWIEEGTAAE
jgi:peptide/nickel transport system substrate-binding protein/oligopeptide transport system substrate-binding protein